MRDWFPQSSLAPQRVDSLPLVPLAGCASTYTGPDVPSQVEHRWVWSSIEALPAKGEVIQGVVWPAFRAHLSMVLLVVVLKSCGFLFRWVVLHMQPAKLSSQIAYFI